MKAHHIALLKLNSDQNVSGSGYSEDQMSSRHARRSPEGDNKSQHNRVAHEFVKERRHESRMGVRLTFRVQIDLPQTEEVKVVDEERTCEN